MKYPVNGPCWCNSGLKYKKCHKDRDSQKPIPTWESERKLRDSLKQKTCSAPDQWTSSCSKTICQAHTVPKSGSLKKIAKDNHVLAFTPSREEIENGNDFGEPQLVGINKASTFYGFCTKHDGEIFSPLEKQVFSASKEQCFLLLYRAYARELYQKRQIGALDDMFRSLDRGRSLEEQMRIHEIIDAMLAGIKAAVKERTEEKKRLDVFLAEQNYEEICSYAIRLDRPPTIMCAGAFNPTHDPDGRPLQDLLDFSIKPALISMSSFASEDNGWVVFVWLKTDDLLCRRYIRLIADLPDGRLTSVLAAFMIELMENCVISPDWWAEIPLNDRIFLKRLAPPSEVEGRRNIDIKDVPPLVTGWSILDRVWLD